MRAAVVVTGVAALTGLGALTAAADVSGTLEATDTSPVSPAPATHVVLPGGAAGLWGGGAFTFPADPDASDGDGSQLYRGVGASLSAARPECDDGTVDITISVRVGLQGPEAVAGYPGRFMFHGVATEYAQVSPVSHTPVGHSEILTLDATVPADELEAGELGVSLWLETHQGGPKAWTADQFQALYEFGTDGCTPTLVDDERWTEPSTPIDVDVLTNDTMPTGNWTPVVVSGPANGTVQPKPDGTITYTPNAGFSGEDTFDYSVTINGEVFTATVTIHVVDPIPLADAGIAGATVLGLGGLALLYQHRRRRAAGSVAA